MNNRLIVILSVFLVFVLNINLLAVTPVTPNTGYYPPGTSIKKVTGSDTFAFEEMSSNGNSGISVDPNQGFLAVSTPTFTIAQTAKVDIGGKLPAGCVGFSLKALGGDMVINAQANLATSPTVIGVVIASGTSVTWSGLASGTTKDIYALPVSAASITGVLTAWGQ